MNGANTSRALAALALVLVLVLTVAATARGQGALPRGADPAGASDALLLLQILLLIVFGRLLGEGLQRVGMPAVMGQLLAGILLGPSVFGLLWPHAQGAIFPPGHEQRAMLDAVSQVGILLLLLLAGMETDLSLVRKVTRAAASASVAGIAFPFAAGFLLGQYAPADLLPDPGHRLIASLFLGTALAISSVKIVASVVREMGFLRRDIGQVIMASAIVDDTIGWIIIAITLGLATHGGFSAWALTRSVAGTLLFLVLSFTLGRRLVFRLIRLTNDQFVSEAAVVAAILAVMCAMALITQAIGVHTVLGAFVAGILVGGSPILTREIDDQIRGITAGLFMPVFFGTAGLHADLTVLRDPRLLLLTAGMLVVASAGKAAGAFAGGWFGGLRIREATALAAGMNARGSTEVIVATIGLSMGVLSQNIYTMIVTMAIVTTLLMPPTLRWALGHVPLAGEEKKRIEREEFEEKGFVSGMERVLLAVDESPSGKLATRLAGLLAGRGGMPVTVLSLPDPEGAPAPKATEREVLGGVRDLVHGAAEQAGQGQRGEPRPPQVEVTARVHDLPPAEAVETEAARGYDLLMVGLEPATALRGGFGGRLSLTVARGAFAEDPLDQRLEIVVPITGSATSLRGAEVALALAQAASAPITAVSIAGGPAKSAGNGRRGRGEDAQILQEIERLARGFDVRVRRLVGKGEAYEAVGRAASHKRRCLVVLGASRRPGQSLSFGPLAADLLDRSGHAMLIVSS